VYILNRANFAVPYLPAIRTSSIHLVLQLGLRVY
jgi:hypothetical protein